MLSYGVHDAKIIIVNKYIHNYNEFFLNDCLSTEFFYDIYAFQLVPNCNQLVCQRAKPTVSATHKFELVAPDGKRRLADTSCRRQRVVVYRGDQWPIFILAAE